MKPTPLQNRQRLKNILIAATALLFVSAILLATWEIPPASAQGYFFNLVEETVHVYWNEDGTSSLEYTFVFQNDVGGGPIEFVDVGMPNASFQDNTISADIDGQPVAYVSRGEFQGDGPGVAVALGERAIPPGGSGTVNLDVGVVNEVLYEDPGDDEYASAVFSPAYFDPDILSGPTLLTVVFHLPPGVQPDEPRWHESPSGFPDQPETALDGEGRVMYTWSGTVVMNEAYTFGASFPLAYVPATAIVQQPPVDIGGILSGVLSVCLPIAFIGGIFAFIFGLGYIADRQNKLKYLPPKIAIEGHGIKRGLTAIEAAILMEQPLDKVLTMILFAVIKKGAAEVKSREPLELDITDPLPENLHEYEKEFLAAFQERHKGSRRKAMRQMMVNLVQGVAQKMKGFSRKETVAYYREIIDRAWSQVEAAGTPEVKSQKYDEVMEWTMLDRNYDDRTREVFRGGPVYVPVWWPRYDPGFPRGGGTVSAPTSGEGRPGGGVSMPTLPGSDFAGSIITGVQTFAKNTVGSITDFTSSVTRTTNPAPPPTTSRSSTRSGGGGGGCACACACACAGCACACAGGGR